MAPQSGKSRWLVTAALVTGLVPVIGCKAPNLSLTRDTPAPLLVAPLRQPREAIPPECFTRSYMLPKAARSNTPTSHPPRLLRCSQWPLAIATS